MLTFEKLAEGKRLIDKARNALEYRRINGVFPKETYDLRIEIIRFCGDAKVSNDGGDSELRYKNKVRRWLNRLQ